MKKYSSSSYVSHFQKRNTSTAVVLETNTKAEKKSPKKRKIASEIESDLLQTKLPKADETETKENIQVAPPKVAAPAITEDDMKKIPPAFSS